MSAITRRTALAAAPAVALTAAVPAIATDRGPALVDDPAVAAVAEWESAWRATWDEQGLIHQDLDDDDPALSAAEDAEDDAHNVACETVATSIAGLAAQLKFAFTVFSDGVYPDRPGYRPLEPYSEPSAYRFHTWSNDRERELLLCMLTAAENLARQA